MARMVFFDLSDRYASLDAKRDPLVEIDAIVLWEEFRPLLERVWRTPGAHRRTGFYEGQDRDEVPRLQHAKADTSAPPEPVFGVTRGAHVRPKRTRPAIAWLNGPQRRCRTLQRAAFLWLQAAKTGSER